MSCMYLYVYSYVLTSWRKICPKRDNKGKFYFIFLYLFYYFQTKQLTATLVHKAIVCKVSMLR